MIFDSLSGLGEALRGGSLSVLDLVDLLEIRLAERAEVEAWVPEEKRFERLRQDALELMVRFSDRVHLPPLFGVPVGVKDIFHVDGLPTAAGSRLPASALQGEEAAVVTRLKEVGALIVGKTVSTEFAYFEPGPTRNPHHPEHTPGGSSSGSAAVVGARMCPLALGTQTIGSIVRPASYCGVVGYKPSYDRISRAGVIPLSESLDHVGFFTPEVDGAALVASLLCDGWRGVPLLERPTLGIPVGAYLERAEPAARQRFEQRCDELRDAGWSLRPVPALDDIAALETRHRRIVAAEAARHHRTWYRQHADLYRPRTVELIELGRTIDDAELAELLAGRSALRAELSALMDEHGLDAWLTPGATGPAPRGLGSTGDPILSLPWSHAGLPSLAIPAGQDDGTGLPLGLQLVSRFGSDEELFAWGLQLADVLTRDQNGEGS